MDMAMSLLGEIEGQKNSQKTGHDIAQGHPKVELLERYVRWAA